MTAKKTPPRKVAKTAKPVTKKATKKPAAKPVVAVPWSPKRPALMLRTCKVGMTGYGGFVWPKSGHIAAPDWKPRAECGNGLHGLLHGEGNGGLLEADAAAHWLVVEVELDEVVELDGKVKVPRGNVVHCGDQKSATEYLAANGCAGRAIAYGVAASGHRGTATAGDSGTATAGYGGTATAGYGGTATAGYGGTATAGDRGTATAGYGGTATAGYGGTATAGDRGTATAGDNGTATAGYGGTATAGYGGSIAIRYWDPKSERYRMVCADIGDDDFAPGVAYVVDETTRKLRRKEVAS